MKHLTILVPDGKGNNLSSIVGAYKIFTRANAYWKESWRKRTIQNSTGWCFKKSGILRGPVHREASHEHFFNIENRPGHHSFLEPQLRERHERRMVHWWIGSKGSIEKALK